MTRGGKRPGAGRKASPQGGRNISVHVRLGADEVAELNTVCAHYRVSQAEGLRIALTVARQAVQRMKARDE